MIIAQQRKKENLAEYILYMWQVEDIIRAYNFDIATIEKNIIAHFKETEEKQKEIYDWYDNLIAMMQLEKIEKSGHLQILKNNVNELFDFHLHLLNNVKDSKYIGYFQQAAGNIAEFKSKANTTENSNDIEICLTALYGILMLKLQQKEISKDTLAAVSTFSQLIAYLTAKYKAFEEEEK